MTIYVDPILSGNMVADCGTASKRTSSAHVRGGKGRMLGFFCNSISGGSVIFHDAAAATNAFTGAITPPAVGWYALPVRFEVGLYVEISATIDITVVFE